MTPEISQSEVQAVDALLRKIIPLTGFQIDFTVTSSPNSAASADLNKDPEVKAASKIKVIFTGPDTPLLTARNGELLNALEHVAAKALQLEEQEHDRIVFDADNFKADRDRELRRAADVAIESVRSTGKPYAFRPMTSHERRLLHLLLAESGLATSSSGETPRRYVMLFPEGYEPGASQPMVGVNNALPVSDRVQAIRSSFRRR